MKIAFLGAGKMATAIACGLLARKVCPPADLQAADKVPAARDVFAAKTGARTVADNAAAIAGADIVILAVKPQDARLALEALRGQFAGKLLVSIAAGLNLAKLAAWTGTDRIVRVMPNTPAMVNLGASVFACAPGVTPADKASARAILEAVGIAREMPESKLDAVTALSGSGPAFVFEFVQAAVDGAVAQGLSPEDALDLFVQTVAGSAEMLRRRLGTPDELRNAVTSPHGTTAAGLAVLQDAHYRALMAQVIQRATQRSMELGQG